MIPYGKHEITQDDLDAVLGVLKGEWLTTGPYVESFENMLSEYLGVPTISVSSGTAALHCAYSAIGIKPGDEVITPPLTFVATQSTAVALGARIRFADILPSTGNIDPACVEPLINCKTKAIVAVDYAGHPANMEELQSIAKRNNLYLIEDAAHSLGSTYKGEKVGSLADLTTFSFFPTKNMTTGEGGAISGENTYLLERAKSFARQGLVRERSKFKLAGEGPWHQEVHEFGLNYRLPDILCALGISQLKRVEVNKEKKRRIFDQYVQELKGFSGILLPQEEDIVESNWHLFPIRVSFEKRARLFNFLRRKGVGVQVNYIPAYWHPAFSVEEYPQGLCVNAEEYYKSEISLPMFAQLESNQVEYICQMVKVGILEQ